MIENQFVITCNTALSKDIKEFQYSPLNSVSTMCDFINYKDRLHVYLRALKRKYIWSDLHFIVDEKVKIFHFHDKDKSWWSSILYFMLYILLLILPELVIDCFELKAFIPLIFDWFLLLFLASTLSKRKLKKCLSSQLIEQERYKQSKKITRNGLHTKYGAHSLLGNLVKSH